MSEEKKWKVYCYTNKVNGKKYIGITSYSLATRAGRGGRKYYDCRHFGSAIQKYGWGSFSPKILCSGLTEDEAKAAETHCIRLLHTTDPNYGYNINFGGTTGSIMTPEGRASFIEKHTGENNNRSKPVSVYTLSGKLIKTFPCGCQAAKYLGVCDVSESCLKKRGTLAGHIVRFADEFPNINQLPESEIYSRYDYRMLYKPVRQYTLDGKYLKTYNSAKEAALAFPTYKNGRTAICACLKGNHKTGMGFMWRYAADTDTSDIEPYIPYQAKRGKELPQSKKVRQLSLTGEPIGEYDSIKEAARISQIPFNTILSCLKGRTKHPTRCLWEYVSD